MLLKKTYLIFLLLHFSSTQSAEVKLGATKIIGQTLSSGRAEFFGGIPYAEPPIGDLRLRSPVLKMRLDDFIFNATNFSPPCLQGPTIGSLPNSSEDCLTINVFRPANTSDDFKLPVMAFIHGGGFLTVGSSVYDGTNLVLRGIDRGTPIIYVSFNYRLGPLGYPQGYEAASEGVLNLGSKDQLTALEWIQQNIEAFGGDPKKVTVFGESAGSISVSLLYFSNLEKYARGAILESGGAGSTVTFPPSRRHRAWDAFVDAIPGCSSSSENTLGCLRGTIDSAVFLKAITAGANASGEMYPFIPTIDGPGGILPDYPSKLYARGDFSRVPFIAGTNLDEGPLFTPSTISTTEQVRDLLISNFTSNSDGTSTPELNTAIDKVLDLYPDSPALGSPFNTGNETFGLGSQYKRAAAILGDIRFQSIRRSWSRAAAKAGLDSYGYIFTGPRPPIGGFPLSWGVSHIMELLYVFGRNPLSLEEPFPNSTPDIALRDTVMDYWLSFATSGSPNDGKGTERATWPKYDSENMDVLEINSQKVQAVSDDYRATQIEFFNEDPMLFGH